MSDGESGDRGPPVPRKFDIAYRRAKENTERWGQQTVTELALALAEETGELSEEVVPPECPLHERDTVGESWRLLRRSAATGHSVRCMLEEHTEDEDGPLPEGERPQWVPEREDIDTEALRDELYDVMALCFQLDWAIYQGVYERDGYAPPEGGG